MASAAAIEGTTLYPGRLMRRAHAFPTAHPSSRPPFPASSRARLMVARTKKS